MRPSTLLATLFCCSLSLLATLQSQSPADYKSNPKFISAMAEAKQESRNTHEYIFAIDSYKKACKIAEQKDEACLSQLYTLQMKTGLFKDAVVTASALEAIAAKPTDKSYAETGRRQEQDRSPQRLRCRV